VNYDWGYKLKQYGTDALVIGGATIAFALLLSPEPIVTKIIGGIIALLCIVGGTLGKHHFFKEAYLSQALEKAVGRLGAQIDQLDTYIGNLETAREGLEATNQSLEKTRAGFEGEVTNLKAQVDRLKTDVNQAFDELNIDRAAFEKQKQAKLSQLNDEIAEADSRGNRAQRKLDGIYERESKLNQFESELETRRKNLVAAETKLESMQAALLRRATNS
jgi:chromosome segregation ATPase